MNLFDILESRMQQIFEGNDLVVPIPFKKLAKQATREMKRNAVRADGHMVAPSLFTVLVSPGDDSMIAPLYQQVTDELVDFVSHEAANANLTMLATPMVRFIADPNVKSGKMDVIAEVVTTDVLEALRQEEAAYTEAHMRVAGAAPQRAGMAQAGVARPAQAQQARPFPQAASQAASGVAAAGVPEISMGMDALGAPAGQAAQAAPSTGAAGMAQVQYADVFDAPVQPVADPEQPAVQARPVSTPMVETPVGTATPAAAAVAAQPAAQPAQAAAPVQAPQQPAQASPAIPAAPAPVPAAQAAQAVPQAQQAAQPVAAPASNLKPAGVTAASKPAQRPYHGLVGAACELTDTASGKRWRIGVDVTVIGRDEATADLVLEDTNVSRRHAELRRSGASWILTDLGSTNGTRVNGMRLRQPAELHDGDTVQMGLIALAFREL